MFCKINVSVDAASGKGSRSSSGEKKGRTSSRADSKKSAASRESRGKCRVFVHGSLTLKCYVTLFSGK